MPPLRLPTRNLLAVCEVEVAMKSSTSSFHRGYRSDDTEHMIKMDLIRLSYLSSSAGKRELNLDYACDGPGSTPPHLGKVDFAAHSPAPASSATENWWKGTGRSGNISDSCGGLTNVYSICSSTCVVRKTGTSIAIIDKYSTLLVNEATAVPVEHCTLYIGQPGRSTAKH